MIINPAHGCRVMVSYVLLLQQFVLFAQLSACAVASVCCSGVESVTTTHSHPTPEWVGTAKAGRQGYE